VRIAGLVSTVCLLPLIAPIVFLSWDGHYHARNDNSNINNNNNTPQSRTQTNQKDNDKDEEPETEIQARHPYRLSILCLTIFPSIYTFFSQSIRYWSPSAIGESRGDGGETYVTDAEWGAVVDLCFGSSSPSPSPSQSPDSSTITETDQLSRAEFLTLGAFHMLSSLTILIFITASLTRIILRRIDARRNTPARKDKARPPPIGAVDIAGIETAALHVNTQETREKSQIRKHLDALITKTTDTFSTKKWAQSLLVATPFGLAVPLLWGFWRLRGIQRRLSLTVRGYYEGNDWGFGQVMAIAIFAPVGAEMLFVWMQGWWWRRDHDGEEIRDGRDGLLEEGACICTCTCACSGGRLGKELRRINEPGGRARTSPLS